MDKTINKKPDLQNRIKMVNSNELASFEEWMAHKKLCRKMFEDAQLSLRISREDYLAQLETVISLHKGQGAKKR